jgi:hypothetical protein
MNAALVIEQEALMERFFYQNRQLPLERVQLPSPFQGRVCSILAQPRPTFNHSNRRKNLQEGAEFGTADKADPIWNRWRAIPDRSLDAVIRGFVKESIRRSVRRRAAGHLPNR